MGRLAMRGPRTTSCLVGVPMPCDGPAHPSWDHTINSMQRLARLCARSKPTLEVSVHFNCYSGTPSIAEAAQQYQRLHKHCRKVSSSAVRGMKSLFWKRMLPPERTLSRVPLSLLGINRSAHVYICILYTSTHTPTHACSIHTSIHICLRV